MKIIIAGAGEVGTHLAKLFSLENQDIVLMDTNEENLNIPYHYEILSVVGNPISIADLCSAGIKGTDLFIAVTPEESTNLTACMLATHLGTQKTIARINNNEYIIPKNSDIFSSLGVTSLICPETLAAAEIVNTLKTPWSRQCWELADGKLILIGVKVRDNAPVINKLLSDLSVDEKTYHIAAINRDSDTLIPRGSDRILSGDILFFITTPEHVNDIRLLSGKDTMDIERVTIVGGSRIAMKVAELLPGHIKIKILEKNKDKCYRLAEKVKSNVMVINGDGRNTDFLIQESIKDCDAFVALTGSSETNILACVTAKNLGVLKTIAEVENIDYIPMAEKLDISSIINKKLIAVSHIYKYMLDADVSTVKSMTFANAEVAELVARPNSKITRKPVKELNLPKDMTLGGKICNGKAEMIAGDMFIQPGDHVIVFCLNSAMLKIEDYFN